MSDTPLITLHGGPWNGREVPYYGTEKVQMAIAESYDGRDRPTPGCRVGRAIYEVDRHGEDAFFFANVWDATAPAEARCDDSSDYFLDDDDYEEEDDYSF